MTCSSQQAVSLLADGSVDAVFIDAEHDRASVEADARAWLPKVKPGGLLCGHDWDRASVREGLAAAGIAARQSALSPSCWEWEVPLDDGMPLGGSITFSVRPSPYFETP